jgi:hypothetical protein
MDFERSRGSGGLPSLFSDTRLNGGKRFLFTKEGRQLISFSIVSLGHISPLGGLRDNSIMDGHILLFRLNIVGSECYT